MSNYNIWNWNHDRVNEALWDGEKGAEHKALFKALSLYTDFPPIYIDNDYFFLGLELAEFDARKDLTETGGEYARKIEIYLLECINSHVYSDFK